MKVLSLTQPWASLVALGAKRIETRSWTTKYRGPLAIHASKGFPRWAQELCQTKVFYESLGWRCPGVWATDLPLGQIIAVVDLIAVRLIRETPSGWPNREYNMIAPPEPELSFGDYTPGRYGWILENPHVLGEAIPAKGALGLWEYPGLLETVEVQGD